MRLYDAFIFDMNGTMIDDMEYHEKAWYHVLINDLKTNMSRAEVKGHMYGKNEELFHRIFGPDKYSKEEIAAISMGKEKRYQQDFLPHLRLIAGLDEFLAHAQAQNILMAIGTAAIPFNVDYVLDHLHIRPYFPVIITADEVAVSKPHPDVFLKAAGLLGVAPERCVVFEDAPKGIEAARRAGMKAVAITSYHTAAALANDNVLCTVGDYRDKALEALIGG